MKKFFFTTLLLTSFFSNSYSQEYFAKGSNMLTASFNIGHSENESIQDGGNSVSESNSYGFSTEYARFIKNNLAIGIRLGYNTSINTSNINYSDGSFRENLNEYKTLYTSILIKKYLPFSEKFGASLNSGINYNFIDSTNEAKSNTFERTSEDTQSRVGLSAGVGIYYFVSKKFSLSLNLGYFNASTIIRETQNGTSINLEDRKSTNFSVKFVNQISFDQLLTINYHF